MWHGSDRSFPAPDRTPDVRGERCVHSLFGQASCRACVDACPKGAWVIDEAMLGIDPDRCDACDLCVAACPEAAIVPRFHPAVRRRSQANLALACCEKAPVSGASLPCMPCLHAIGTLALLQLARADVRYLITSAGNCAECPRGGADRLENRLPAVNALLISRGLPPITHLARDGADWLKTWHQTNDLASQEAESRRAFFRSILAEPARCVEKILDRAEGRSIEPGRVVPRRSPRDPAPFVPVLDPRRCTGCDACVRVCPHQAIRIELEDGLPASYRIEADSCTGCGICKDVCEQGAVRVSSWQAVESDRLPLSNQRCPSCGVTYHIPSSSRVASPEAEDSCPVCSKNRHHRNLFQVLD
jgi:ferredoxin